MNKYSVDRNPIVENLGYRIRDYYRNAVIQIGTGNANGEILVIQPHTKMPDRDAITGALKNFGMLKDSYRATSLIVDYDNHQGIEYSNLFGNNRRGENPMTQREINRYYLKELIEVICPSIVIACGADVLSLLRKRKVRSFSSHTGKKFRVPDMTGYIFFATLNPTEYGFARAPQELKEQGKKEWTDIAAIYRQCKEKLAKERWAC